MSALLAPLPPVPPPALARWPRPAPEFAGRRYTIPELYDLDQPERFGGRRLFLLHGEVWEQGMANLPHDEALEAADAALRPVFPTGYRIRIQLGMRLSDGTEVQPDVLIVSGSKQPRGQSHPTTADLIVEVSDSSLFFDSTTKAELYAAAGVPEYWVIDVNARTLMVLRDPAPVGGNGHAYRSSRTLTGEAT